MKQTVSSVFLNVPFDSAYEPYFLALISAVVAVGRLPRSVLELPELGAGRLSRLLQQIQECDLSIHDLSRVGLPSRFNMPFELGLACSIASEGSHGYVLLERVPHRLDRTLSDVKGRDPYIYGTSVRRLIGSVLDALEIQGRTSPDVAAVMRLRADVASAVAQEKRRRSAPNVFSRSLFRFAVASAATLAATDGLIEEGYAA